MISWEGWLGFVQHPSRHNPECLTHERMFEEAKDVERKTHSMNKGMKKISQQDVKKGCWHESSA
jgi:hypothetical protein